VSGSTVIGVTTAAAGGIGIAVQSAVMGRFGERIGTVPAVTFAMVVGMVVAVLLLAVVERSFRAFPDGLSSPKWLWLGGALGTFVVLTFTVAAPRIGVTATLALLIGGQLLMGVIIDEFGWFGFDRIAISPVRAVGLALMAVSVVLLIRK
jgi:transporter family-2 protein